MGEIRIDFGKFGSRSKGMSLGLALLGAALFLVDFVVLRGEHVASDSVSLASGEPALLRLDRIGEEHLVEIDTRRRVHRKQRGRAVELRFEDPEGRLAYQSSELVAHKERSFSFTPTTAGEYRLYVKGNGLLGASSSGSARVDVYVNDHRIFGRLFSFVSF
jgi:hypothetical protein